MNFSVMFFLLPSTNSLGVTVVNLVYTYFTRGIHFFCLFVCLRSVTALFPRGQLPKEDLRRSPSTTQATRHPRALSQSLFPLPPYLCHASCIRSVPSPVLYIYPIESLVCFFLVFQSYTYIQTPQKRTPQQTSNPTYKLC